MNDVPKEKTSTTWQVTIDLDESETEHKNVEGEAEVKEEGCSTLR